MSAVRTNHNLKKVQQDFELALQNLSNVLKEIRPKANILNTKLGKIKKDLDNLPALDNDSLARVAEIASKYITLNYIFNSDVKYNKKDLLKVIEGKSDYKLDSNDNYNDYFFELSMGIRFLLSQKDNTRINLDGACDVIINDAIAIECKYIHSKNNLLKNISKANKQINKRIADNQAKLGFIALDMSHICSEEKIRKFINVTFDNFLDSYKSLASRGHVDDILQSLSENKNFKEIIGSFITHEAEVTLFNELGFNYDMGSNSYAILYQAVYTHCFDYEGSTLPITFRGMTYLLNSKIPESQRQDIQKFIHNLAVGV